MIYYKPSYIGLLLIIIFGHFRIQKKISWYWIMVGLFCYFGFNAGYDYGESYARRMNRIQSHNEKECYDENEYDDDEYDDDQEEDDEYSDIGHFCGIKLGMTLPEVRSALASQGKTMENYNSKYPDSYKVTNISLGGYSFDELYLSFNNSKLAHGNLWNEDAAGGFPEGEAFNRVERNARYYRTIYNEMCVKYREKYGEPFSNDENMIVWKKGSNKITLKYSFTDDMDGPYMRQSRAFVNIHYEIIDISSSNY